MTCFDFTPPAWLRNRHAQTVAGRVLRTSARFEWRRVHLDTPDGDVLLVDTVPGARLPPDAPWCLILHGLEGSSSSGYVLGTARRLAERGVRPVALNFRSCGGEMNRLVRSYHSGETGDIRLVAEWLDATLAGPGAAIGFSLGGNALLCALAEAGTETPFQAAAAASVPFDLAAGAACLDRGPARLYARLFLASLHRKIARKADLFPDHAGRARLALRARTIRGVDEAWTAPIHGFAGADDYYARCSSLPRLPDVRVPTLLIHALDDPFVPADVARAASGVRNPALYRGFTRHGGHLGFVGRGLRLRAEERAARWITEVLSDRGAREADGRP